ncbi:MAG: hypothetical protein FWF26_06330 [Treponema sp.]|nr:hypothetical protein [Treponema sp.]
MRKVALLAICAVILSLSSCDEFFSNSLGTFRTYDPAKIDVNAGNINDWIRASIGNQKLAQAVSEAILRKLANLPPGSPERAALLAGGIRIAIESSGISESILSRCAELLGKGDDITQDTVQDLLAKIQGDFNSNGGPQAADKIAQMVGESISGNPPQFDPAYADNVEAGDVAQAIMILVLGQLGDSTTDNWDDLNFLDSGLSSDGQHISYGGEDPNVKALAAYLNLISGNPEKFGDNSLTGSISDALINKK